MKEREKTVNKKIKQEQEQEQKQEQGIVQWPINEGIK